MGFTIGGWVGGEARHYVIEGWVMSKIGRDVDEIRGLKINFIKLSFSQTLVFKHIFIF